MPRLRGIELRAQGVQSGHQRWQCKQCGKKFQANRKAPPEPEELFCRYTFNKQTLAELAQAYHKKTKEIQCLIDQVVLPSKQHDPRPISLVIDTTFVGDLGIVVFRDQIRRENLWWAFVETENTHHYARGKRELEKRGYTIRSVTADGLPGLPAVFSGIPFQFCHFHAKKNVTKYLTRKPKTQAGIELRILMSTIHEYTHDTFVAAVERWQYRYQNFLNEKTFHPGGGWSYTHQCLRSALRSMLKMAPHLFTYQHYNFFIPTTTNTLEGHFRHLKVRVKTHAGLSPPRKVRLIALVLLNSTTKYRKDMHKRLF